jgi:Flp pilus assembly protein TadD
MTRRVRHSLLAVAVLAVPAAVCGWWWHHGPSYTRARELAKAEQALQDNNLAGAEKLLRQLSKEEPNEARVQFLYAQVLRRLGRRQEADVVLLRAVQLGLPESEGRRENALLEADEDFAVAEPVLRRILEERPDDLDVLQALAQGYAASRRWTDAERVYTTWLAQQPDRPDLLFERGRVRLEAGRFAEAAADFREVLRGSSAHYRARLLLAHCLLSEARMPEAEAALRTCHRLRPERPEPLVGLANCAQERGDLNEAQKRLKQALALDPSSIVALHAQGNLYLRSRRYDLAVPVFERIVRLNPRDKQAHLKLAQALSQTGDLERGRKHERLYQELDRADRH